MMPFVQLFHRMRRATSRLARPGVLVLVALILVAAAIPLWDWLHGDGDSNSATLRNIGLVIAAVIALLLALWRSAIAERQADAAHHQSEIAMQNMLNGRFQKGVEMLGSKVLSVRLGGIYALQRLAEEHPTPYHIQIIQLFCAFARNPCASGIDDAQEPPLSITDCSLVEEKPSLREDVQNILYAIGFRSEIGIKLEEENDFKVDLRNSDFQNARFSGANFSGVIFDGANLSHAKFADTNLTNAHLSKAELSNAVLWGTKLPGAMLFGANLSGAELLKARLSGAHLNEAILIEAKLHQANLSRSILVAANLSGAELTGANISGAILLGHNGAGEVIAPAAGLTQAQLDEACAAPDTPPRLDGAVLDAETGKPLIWQGEPVDIDRFPWLSDPG